MKKTKLRTQLSAGFACIVFAVIFLVSISANLLIRSRFEKYIENEQIRFSEDLSENLAEQYDVSHRKWNTEYIHGVGMYAVNDGYFLKIKDSEKNTIWDIEQHDMQCCMDMMNKINETMERLKNSDGKFVSHEYPLIKNDNIIGYAEIKFYTPYYMNENAFDFLDSLNIILAVTGIFSLAGAVIAGIVLSRKITDPISEIIEHTVQIADGNYEKEYTKKSSCAEISELSESVSEMAYKIRNQDKLRKQLTSDVAHELRTPLTNIASHLEMISEGIWEPTSERIESCCEELRRITSLVDDMEKLHRTEDENLILHKETFPVRPLFESVYSSFEKEFADKNINCIIDCGDIEINADKNKIMQVVTNLVSNAVKYSLYGREISMTAQNNNDCAEIIISDCGTGISEEDLPHIFERFYRADKSRNRSTGGAGIGLAIVKAIVEAHKGNISVESIPEMGSVFTVQLPAEIM